MTLSAHDDAQQPDGALIEQANLGQRPAFDVLMRRHQPRMANLARRTMGNNADAEDVSSAAASFLSNKKYANQFISDQLLLDWLYRDSRSLMREAARLLVTRGNEEGVAEAALQNDPETRMRFFEVLVKGGGGYNSVVYSPRGEVVRQVWERCARENSDKYYHT